MSWKAVRIKLEEFQPFTWEQLEAWAKSHNALEKVNVRAFTAEDAAFQAGRGFQTVNWLERKDDRVYIDPLILRVEIVEETFVETVVK